MICTYDKEKVLFVVDDAEALDVIVSHAIYSMGAGGIPSSTAAFLGEMLVFGPDRLVATTRVHDKAKASKAVKEMLEAICDMFTRPDDWEVSFDGSTLQVWMPAVDAMRWMIAVTSMLDLLEYIGDEKADWIDRIYAQFIHYVPEDVLLASVASITGKPTTSDSVRALKEDKARHKIVGLGDMFN